MSLLQRSGCNMDLDDLDVGGGIKDKKKPVILASAVIIVLVILFLFIWLAGSLFTTRTVSSWFESGRIMKGESTTLYVEVTNTFGKDMRNVTVTATASDPAHLHLSGSPKIEGMMGTGERRKFEFPVKASADSRAGRYGISVSLRMGTETTEDRVYLEISET
jgi:uncharacterized membrane protein